MQLTAPKLYWELNKKTGNLEQYDTTTGKLVAVISADNAHNTNKDLEEVRLPNGDLVSVEKGVDKALLLQPYYSRKGYSPMIMEALCAEVAAGRSLTDVCHDRGMPCYSTLMRWRRLYPEVEEMLQKARIDRAETLRDKAMETAMASDEDNVASSRLKVDTLKWAAGKDDPNKYEAKPEKMQVNVAPTAILIQTGIDRGEAQNAHAHEIKDVQNQTVIDAADTGGVHPTVQVASATTTGE